MPRLARIYRRFVVSTRGVAAIEFAMVLPMLLLLFLGTIDAGRAIAVYMKLRSATYTLNSITNQYITIHDTDMQQILGATAVVLAPYPSAPVTVVISQLSVSSAGQATVSWSDTLNGTARSVHSTVTIPAALASPVPPNNVVTCARALPTDPCYLILGEVNYTYTPMFGYFITGPIVLSDKLYVTPRLTPSITRSP
jgi:Flp pilus assembly protein TadG